MVTEEDEEQVFQENFKEAVEETKNPEPTGKAQGIIGIILGIIGFFTPSIIGMAFGMLALMLGAYSVRHGQRKLGVLSGVIGLLDFGFALFFYFRPPSLIF